MVRSVQVDESVQQYADQRILKRAGPEIGILIGRTTGGKDMLLHIVPCPFQDADLPPIRVSSSSVAHPPKKSTSGAKGKSSGNSSAKVDVDEEWIIEHAAQASRTLPGGLDILGLFVFCEEPAFQSSHSLFSKLIKGMQREILSNGDAASVVIHIDAVTAKISAREVDSSSSLRPCEVKSARLTSNMTCVKCSYSVDMHLSFVSGKSALHAAIDKAIQWEYNNKISPAIALLGKDNTLMKQSLDTPLIDAIATTTNNTTATEIQLLVPLSSTTLPPPSPAIGITTATSMQEHDNEYKQLCSFELTGNIDCRAYINKREPVRAAIDALKHDIQRSLKARLGVLVEAADMATSVAEEKRNQAIQRGDVGASKDPLPKHPLLLPVDEVRVYSPVLPRRAFLPWKQGGGCYCDYLVEGEGSTEAMQRIEELMGSDCVDGCECLEGTGDGKNMTKKKVSGGGGGSSGVNSTMIAVIVLILAILIGYMMLM